jgi:hypothetical protein
MSSSQLYEGEDGVEDACRSYMKSSEGVDNIFEDVNQPLRGCGRAWLVQKMSGVRLWVIGMVACFDEVPRRYMRAFIRSNIAGGREDR